MHSHTFEKLIPTIFMAFKSIIYGSCANYGLFFPLEHIMCPIHASKLDIARFFNYTKFLNSFQMNVQYNYQAHVYKINEKKHESELQTEIG